MASVEQQQPDKISAYYSLVFPSITYYLQTLNVTIGRRCIPANSPSSSAAVPQVDIDLGALKSVSRLHANIDYDESEERFVLAVHGRNGAWVDGVWSGSGSRVPLNEKSQIQIASRTFHFVLPPPPPLDSAPPEDSPSPATSHSSPRRERSPSVDITSISPDSSIPSDSPPPPKPPDGKQHQSAGGSSSAATASSKPRTTGPTSKKRKKSDTDVPIVKPETMPPKPPLTYAQMCHRAIKAMGGKATLQDIIAWMIESFDWYKYNVGSGWESSVRHNLSSGKTFKKMERSTGERGKGFYWSIDENFEHIILEQDAKLLTSQSAAASKDGKGTNRKTKGPLPPPLTSAPLAMKSASSSMSTFRAHLPPTATIVKSEPPSAQSIPPRTDLLAGVPVTTSIVKAEPSTTGSSLVPASVSAIPSSVRIPIIVGPVPASHVPSASTELSSSTSPHLPTPPIVLHENTLILNPTIFGHLTADQLKGLETLGAQKALEILQGYIVRFLKERIRTEGGRGRGRGNGVRGRGRGTRGGNGCAGRGGKKESAVHVQNAGVTDVISEPVSVSVQSQEIPSAPAGADHQDVDVVIDIMDDEDDEEQRASKKRRLDEALSITSTG